MSQWFKIQTLKLYYWSWLGCIIKSLVIDFMCFLLFPSMVILFDIWSKKKTDAWESSINPSYSPQWIKDKIAWTLKVLQKHYITADTAVTSEDLEANLLCCALEAIFIHGIKSKFIRFDGSHARKGGSRALPQPVFWSLLKTVTHRWVRERQHGFRK